MFRSIFVANVLFAIAVSRSTQSELSSDEAALLGADDACSADRADCAVELLQVRGGARTAADVDPNTSATDGDTDQAPQDPEAIVGARPGARPGENVTVGDTPPSSGYCCFGSVGVNMCNGCGEWAKAGTECDDEDRCGGCGGSWCVTRCVFAGSEPDNICGTAFWDSVAESDHKCGNSGESCESCGGAWCGVTRRKLPPTDEDMIVQVFEGPDGTVIVGEEEVPNGEYEEYEEHHPVALSNDGPYYDNRPQGPEAEGPERSDLGADGRYSDDGPYYDNRPQGPEAEGPEHSDLGADGRYSDDGPYYDNGPQGPEAEGPERSDLRADGTYRGDGRHYDNGPQGPEAEGPARSDLGADGSYSDDGPYYDNGPQGPEAEGPERSDLRADGTYRGDGRHYDNRPQGPEAEGPERSDLAADGSYSDDGPYYDHGAQGPQAEE